MMLGCWEEIGHKGHSPAAATNEKEAMEDCGVGEGFQDLSVLRRSSPLPKPPREELLSSLSAVPGNRDSRPKGVGTLGLHIQSSSARWAAQEPHRLQLGFRENSFLAKGL